MSWDSGEQAKLASAAMIAAQAFSRLVTLIEKLVEREFKKMR